jgi:transketolase
MNNTIDRLKKIALKLRQKTFKAFIETKEAHLGGSFSMIEILISIYEIIMKKNDKFILSKAHSSFPLIIYLQGKGIKLPLKTHLELNQKKGINCTAGSLGHGLPIATGMAFAKKIKKEKGKIYVLISDGECQEGTTWESLLLAAKLKLDNLIVVVDYNKIQALTKLTDGLPLENLPSKFKAFNWNCVRIKDGHSFSLIIKAFNKKQIKNKPTLIIADTIKGKGVKEFENNPIWHARKLNQKEILIGKKRLKLK